MFTRSMRSLARHGPGSSVAALCIAIVLLGAWGTWFVLARIAVYEVSDAARLEVDRATHPVDAPVTGRVIASHLALGARVRAGDVLAELDAGELQTQLAADQATLASFAPQMAALRQEITARGQVLEQLQRTSVATLAEARARHREAEAQRHFSADEARRMRQMMANHHVAEIDALRVIAEADQRRAQTDALRLEVARLEQEQRGLQSEQRAQLAALERTAAEMTSQRDRAAADVTRLAQQIELRTIRAPVDGRLGEVRPVQIGSMLQVGDRLAAVVPDGRLRVVAEYAPATAVGWIRAGQHARLRLAGFPWTQYGTLSATVTSVASELRDGRVRVELAVNPDARSRIPAQHGLPGAIEIEVERASPAALLLRAAGHWLGGTGTASAQAPQPGAGAP